MIQYFNCALYPSPKDEGFTAPLIKVQFVAGTLKVGPFVLGLQGFNNQLHSLTSMS